MAEHEASSSAKADEEKAAVLSQYCNHLDKPRMYVYELLSILQRMVDEHPQYEKDLLMKVSPKLKRTYLHVAVIANSEEKVQSLLEKMKADKDRAASNMEYFSTVEVLSGFTAYQMACVVGNGRILQMINTATGTNKKSCGNSPTSSGATSAVVAKDIKEIGNVLKTHLEVLKFPDNFLKFMSLGGEFRLHASLTTGDPATIKCWKDYHKPKSNNIAELLKGLISELAGASVLSTFLQLRDSAGRCILHYLADFSQVGYADSRGDAVRTEIFTTFMDELESEKLKSHVPKDYMNCKDNVGRTPLHLAAAQGFEEIVGRFANNAETDLNATFGMEEKEGEQSYDIRGISALSLAAACNHFDIVKSLCEAQTLTPRKFEQLIVNMPITTHIQLRGHFNQRHCVRWSPLQLAAFKGHVETLEELLKMDGIYGQNQLYKILDAGKYRLNTAPILHLAALGGKPHAIRALLKHKKIDMHALDSDGNTSLYYALQHSQFEDACGPWEFINILQCFHHYTNELPMSTNGGAMKACLELLLQAGVNMDQENYSRETPKIGPKTPKDVQDWWYERLAKELQVAKERVSAATNAVSVVATLVAATSFVGPLQPPLGLSFSTDPENMWMLGYSQVNHVAIDIFLVFDNLSFYLAIASIMLALIPNLPIDKEGDLHGVRLGTRYLRFAVVLLFASITSLICTFSAASVVIIPGGRWKYKATIVSTTILGVFICVIALVLFLKRLCKLCKLIDCGSR